MRRFVHHTTAITACLTLLTPHLAESQTRVPDDKALKQMQARAENQPARSEALLVELAAGLKPGQLRCADGGNRPCADGVGLVTPGGLAVQLSESGQIFLASRAAQQAVKESRGKAGGKSKKDLERQLKKAEKQQADAEKRNKADNQQSNAEKRNKADRQQADAEKKPKKRPEDKDRRARQSTDDTRPKGRPQDEARAPKATEERPQRSERGMVRLVNTDQAERRAEKLGGLQGVLTDEIDKGLKESQLSCLTGGSFPCDAGTRVMTPRGVILEPQQNGRFLIAQPGDQMYRVTSGKMVRRAAEEDTRKTAAAREAARQDKASTAAALADKPGKPRNSVERTVTRENTRSSDQDFTANLRDALAGQLGQTAGTNNVSKDDDDNDNDLAKALLLGLGAVAVGSMLNNNRQVALATPDRVVVTREDGSQEVIKDEVALLREPGSTVTTEDFDDGSSRTIVTRADGSKVVTIRDANLQVLRRTLVSADGKSTRLIDDTESVQPVDLSRLPQPATELTSDGPMDEAELARALRRESQIDRRFTLGQIRNIPEVRSLVAPVDIDAITFDTGSAAIRPAQARQLASLGDAIQDAIDENPQEIFMIEGHTDTVGGSATNLALSDRRAESVALALSEYFDVPRENLVVQGYGEQFLKIRSEGDVRANRRASVRRITDLLQTASVD